MFGLPRADCRRRGLGEGTLDLFIMHVYNRLIFMVNFLLGRVSFYLQLP